MSSEKPTNGSTALQPVGTQETLKQLLAKNQEAFGQVLPAYLTPERLVKVTLLAALVNPEILDCTRNSIIRSVMVAAQIGLEIGPTSGHLVPFKRNIAARNQPERWITEAQFIPDYRGLISQAKRCNALTRAQARVVYVDDIFKVDYGQNVVVHEPDFSSKKRKDENIVAIWFEAILPDGDKQLEVMTKEEIGAIRDRAKSKFGPWKTDFAEMGRKTVVKRGLKYVPNLDDRTIAAIVHDNRIESGEINSLSTVLDSESSIQDDIASQTRERTDRLADEMSQTGPATTETSAVVSDAGKVEQLAGSEQTSGPAASVVQEERPSEESSQASLPVSDDAPAGGGGGYQVQQADLLTEVIEDALVIEGVVHPVPRLGTNPQNRIKLNLYSQLGDEAVRLGRKLGELSNEMVGCNADALSEEAAKIFLTHLQGLKPANK